MERPQCDIAVFEDGEKEEEETRRRRSKNILSIHSTICIRIRLSFKVVQANAESSNDDDKCHLPVQSIIRRNKKNETRISFIFFKTNSNDVNVYAKLFQLIPMRFKWEKRTNVYMNATKLRWTILFCIRFVMMNNICV